MTPHLPTGFDARTKRAFGPLCYWDAWIDAGRPALVLKRILTSGPVPGAQGEQLGGLGVPAAAENPLRHFSGVVA